MKPKHSLKLAKESVGKAQTAFTKLAQDLETNGGNLSPDEVKEMAQNAEDALGQALEVIDEITEGVPSSDNGESEENPDNSMEGMDENNHDPEKKPLEGQGDEEEEEKMKHMEAKLAKQDKIIAELQAAKLASDKEKLATKYASLFPPKMRSAKFKEFMKSKDDLTILQAKLDTTQELINSKSIKVASERDSLDTINNRYNVHDNGETTLLTRSAKGQIDLGDI